MNMNIDMKLIVKTEIHTEKYYLIISEILHAIKYNTNKELINRLVFYNPLDKHEYSEKEFERLVNIATILDIKITDKKNNYWFRDCDKYKLDYALYPKYTLDINEKVFLQFVSDYKCNKHNVYFYDRDLEVY